MRARAADRLRGVRVLERQTADEARVRASGKPLARRARERQTAYMRRACARAGDR